MANKKPKEDTFKVKYIFKDDYNPKFINGAYGGISPRGEIVVNFYLERIAIPNSQTFKIVDGKREEQIDSEPKDHSKSIVRFVENGIILDYNNAKEIHRWLGEHIKKLEDAING